MKIEWPNLIQYPRIILDGLRETLLYLTTIDVPPKFEMCTSRSSCGVLFGGGEDNTLKAYFKMHIQYRSASCYFKCGSESVMPLLSFPLLVDYRSQIVSSTVLNSGY
jgi:hypothetical protein